MLMRDQPETVLVHWPPNQGFAQRRKSLRVGGSLTLGMFALCVVGIVYDFVHFGPDGGTYFVSAIVGAFGIFNLWLSLFAFRGANMSPATELTANEEGLHLKLADGAVLSYPFRARGSTIKITQLNNPASDGRPAAYLLLSDRQRVGLTVAESQSLLRLAERAGMVTRRKSDWVKYRGAATSYILTA